MAFSTNQQTVVDLFIAAYGRAPAQSGLDYWANELDSGNRTRSDIAEIMMNNNEGSGRYPTGLTTDEKVAQVFQNVLGRAPATQAGKDFWAAKFDDSSYTMVNLVDEILNVARDGNPGDEETLNNKSQVVEYFLSKVPASEQVGKQVYTDSVVTDADVADANTAIDNMAQVAGDTIYLTNGGLFTGTADNDTFIASRGEIGDATIQAKEGTDTLKATVNSSDNNTAVTSYDLENIMITNTASSSVNIDLLEANGLKEVWNNASSDSANLELSGVSKDVAVGIKETNTSTTVNYQSVSGATDTVNVKLDGSKEGASFIATGVENLNLDVQSNSYLDVSANSDLEKVVITSSSDMTIKSKGSDISITGGEGEDTLILDGALGANLVLSSIENLAVNATTTLDLDNVNIEEVVSLNGTLTANNVEDEKILITSDDDATNSSIAGLTATLKSATGTDDAISVEVLNKDTATDKNIQASLTLADTEILNIETNADTGANEKVTIDLTTSTTGTANQTLNISGNAVAEFATTAVASKTINASSNTAGVELKLGVEDQTITGTAQSDIFDFGVNGNADDTVDGGAGDDMVMFELDGADEVSAVTSNVETASVTFTSANSFDSANLAGVSLIKVNGATGTLSNILAGTDVEIDGDATALTLALKDDTGTSDVLNVQLDNSGDQTVTALTANGVETLNFSVLNDDADATTISTLSADDAKAIIISSQEESFEITNFTTPDLTVIDVRGFGGNLTLGELANSSSATITLGNQKVDTVDVSLTLESAKSISDTISFGDSLIGDVVINNFKEGNSIAADSIDFSAYGVNDVSDLTISTSGTDTIIDIAGDANFGQVTLIGVTHTDLVDANFDFA